MTNLIYKKFYFLENFKKYPYDLLRNISKSLHSIVFKQ